HSLALYSFPTRRSSDLFDPPQDYLVLWKLEVLPEHRGNNYARLLVDYAKQYQLPIKTNPFIDSHGFWKHMGFEKASYNMERDLGENPYIWMPKGVQQRSEEHTSELQSRFDLV